MKYVIVLLLFVTGCTLVPGPGPKPDDTNMCGQAGLNLEKLKCLDSRGGKMWINSKGVPFEKTCQRAQDIGGAALDPVCIANAKTCEEANVCPMKMK